MKPWAVEVLSVGAASVGAVAWRLSGRLNISAIVKATFSFAPGATMTHTLPVPLRAAEVHPDDDPAASIREPLDTAPELARTDVIFVGHACTPALEPAPRISVRLGLRTRTDSMLVDKSLEVLGNRVFMPGRPQREPAPFTRIPMVYERAYGGPDYDANPVGVGQLAELAGRRRLPNIVHPEKLTGRAIEPAGFGPISNRWPVRQRLLGVTPVHVLERPIAEIPGELDRSYFQSAPADQQTRQLEGDEWIVLEGLHPSGALTTRLPSARGVARVYLPNGSIQPITLVADTLLIDGDAEQVSITWRGSFPIPSEADLPATAVAGGVELPGRPALLPDRFPSQGRTGFAAVPGVPLPPVPGVPLPLPLPAVPLPPIPGVALPPLPGVPLPPIPGVALPPLPGVPLPPIPGVALPPLPGVPLPPIPGVPLPPIPGGAVPPPLPSVPAPAGRQPTVAFGPKPASFPPPPAAAPTGGPPPAVRVPVPPALPFSGRRPTVALSPEVPGPAGRPPAPPTAAPARRVTEAPQIDIGATMSIDPADLQETTVKKP